MEKRKSVEDEVEKFHKLDREKISIDQKLDELLNLLESSSLDSQSVTQIKDKFNAAVNQRVEMSIESLEEFKQLDELDNRLELADNLELLLSQYQVDNKVSKKIVLAKRLRKVTILIIAIIFITLGFGMIIMPAPPYFEMFTIFWFSIDDGVTLMDLIALLIVFTGVYLFINSLISTKRIEHV